MLRSRILLIAIFLSAIVLALLSVYFQDQYLLFSIVLILLMMAPFFIRFERRKLDAKEIVLIAILAAIAAVSRVPFAPLPSVQPTTFVIIVSALVFGAETGFMIGAVAALVSNLFLGQGPWTPWQMFAWGMVGYSAGMLRNSWWMGKKWVLLFFGFVWGFLFGWVMNLSFVFGFMAEVSISAFLTAMLSSAFFDLAHALSNVFFLAVFGSSWIKILLRFKKKYGLLY